LTDQTNAFEYQAFPGQRDQLARLMLGTLSAPHGLLRIAKSRDNS
jgi:hypothetical protein